METIVFGVAVMSLISYFIQLTIDPNISFLETLIISVSGGVVLQDLHELITRILIRGKETGV